MMHCFRPRCKGFANMSTWHPVPRHPPVDTRAPWSPWRQQGKGRRHLERSHQHLAEAAGRKGATAKGYDERTRAQLLERARELDIKGRSSMSKAELIDALRNH